MYNSSEKVLILLVLFYYDFNNLISFKIIMDFLMYINNLILLYLYNVFCSFLQPHKNDLNHPKSMQLFCGFVVSVDKHYNCFNAGNRVRTIFILFCNGNHVSFSCTLFVTFQYTFHRPFNLLVS